MTANMNVLYIYAATSLILSFALFIIHNVCGARTSKLDKYLPAILIGAYTCRWYCISVSFTIFNKWFLNHWEGGFSFPILYSAMHMILKFSFSRVWAYYSGVKVEPLPWQTTLLVVAPIGCATALDVMLSNWSLRYVTVTVYTIIKASVVLWTFFWGVVLKLESFKCKTCVAVFLISLGLSIAVFTTTNVSPFGVALVLLASALGGVRWALTQQLMTVDEQSKDVFVALYRFAPYSAVCLPPLAIIIEGNDFLNSDFASFSPVTALLTLFVLVGGLIAFGLIITEVHLVFLTSSLTMGVLGQLKELLQIGLAMMIFQDNLTLYNAAGIILALASVVYYKVLRYNEWSSGHGETQRKYLELSQVEQLELDELEEVFNDTSIGLHEDDDPTDDYIY